MPPERPRVSDDQPPPSYLDRRGDTEGIYSDQPLPSRFSDELPIWGQDWPDESPSVEPTPEPTRNIFNRAAASVEDAFDDIREKRPGWRKKVAGFVLGTVVHLGILGGAIGAVSDIGEGSDKTPGDEKTEQTSKDSEDSKNKTTAIEAIDPLLAGLRAEYESSAAVKLDEKFEGKFLTEVQRQEINDQINFGELTNIFGDMGKLQKIAKENPSILGHITPFTVE